MRLFDENYEWTDEAREVSRFASSQLEEIFKKFPEYSPREVAHIISTEVNMRECEAIFKLRKEIKENAG